MNKFEIDYNRMTAFNPVETDKTGDGDVADIKTTPDSVKKYETKEADVYIPPVKKNKASKVDRPVKSQPEIALDVPSDVLVGQAITLVPDDDSLSVTNDKFDLPSVMVFGVVLLFVFLIWYLIKSKSEHSKLGKEAAYSESYDSRYSSFPETKPEPKRDIIDNVRERPTYDFQDQIKIESCPIREKGKQGELKTKSLITSTLPEEKYYLINDVTFPRTLGTTQIDHILVSPYGVFVIETKNMSGWIFGKEEDRKWTQTFKNKKRYSFNNPLRQVNYHANSVASLINIYRDKIFPIVVFAGESEFKTDIPDNVKHTYDFISYIRSKQSIILSERDIKRIIKEIDELRLPLGIETDIKHIKYVKEIHY